MKQDSQIGEKHFLFIYGCSKGSACPHGIFGVLGFKLLGVLELFALIWKQRSFTSVKHYT